MLFEFMLMIPRICSKIGKAMMEVVGNIKNVNTTPQPKCCNYYVNV